MDWLSVNIIHHGRIRQVKVPGPLAFLIDSECVVDGIDSATASNNNIEIPSAPRDQQSPSIASSFGGHQGCLVPQYTAASCTRTIRYDTHPYA